MMVIMMYCFGQCRMMVIMMYCFGQCRMMVIMMYVPLWSVQNDSDNDVLLYVLFFQLWFEAQQYMT